MNRVGIFGTSGMAREAGDIAFALGLKPIYVARDQAEIEALNLSVPILLEEELTRQTGMLFVIGIGDGSVRRNIAERYKDLSFTNLIHPSATFGLGQREIIGNSRGIIVAAGVRFTSGISVGDFCIFNQNVTVAHDCVVGNYVHIAPGANVSGNVHLHDGCWVGAGSIVNQGNPVKRLEVGANTIVGSGAVVISDCDPDAVYAGVPATRVK